MSIHPGNLTGAAPRGLKGEPQISKAIRQSAKGENCTLVSAVCNHNPETVVFCHIRLPGDGIGRKPPDYFGFYGCSACHALQEARDITSGAYGFEDLLIALRRTQEKLVAKGLLHIGRTR